MQGVLTRSACLPAAKFCAVSPPTCRYYLLSINFMRLTELILQLLVIVGFSKYNTFGIGLWSVCSLRNSGM